IYCFSYITQGEELHVKRFFALLALCVVTAAQPVSATPTGPDVQRLTLREAVKSALELNSLLKAAGFSASAASQGITMATSRYYPGIFLEESFAASNAPTQTFMMKLDQGRFSQDDFQTNSLNHPSAHHDFKT